jgi:hypothetical protein
MARLKILFLFFLLTGAAVYAQSDFRPGYVLLTSGDTLRGEIDLRATDEMSKECYFRKGKGSEQTLYGPDLLKEFRLDDGRYFLSINLPGRGQVFVEYLVNGRLNLYHFSDKSASIFLVRKEGDTIREIPREPEYVMIKDLRYERPPLLFRGLMESLTEEAPELKADINTVDPENQKQLTKLVVDYHKAVCSNEECLIYKKESSIKVYIQPVAGVSRYFDYSGITYDAGVNVLFWMPDQSERLYFKTGFLCGVWPNSGNAFNIKLPFQLRYFVSGRPVRPEVSIGPEFYLNGHPDYNTTEGPLFDRLFNVNTALNVKFPGKEVYWTIGGGVSTSPLIYLLLSDRNFEYVSVSMFTGISFKF